MLHEIFEGIAEFFRALFTMIGLGSLTTSQALETKLRVFIKQAGRTISVDLDPTWNVRKIKSIVAPKLNLSPEELKIIFAGRELLDDMILQTCDVGQKSCLYAVKVQIHTSRQSNSKTDETASASITTESVATDKTDSLVSTSTKNLDKTHLVDEETNSTDVFVAHQANKQSNFFVYCNTCEDIQEGKLRVRCDTCLSGAFLVLRDPENWEDVLTPKQVPGSCETPGCLGNNFAQFFFKCSNHVTTGEEDTVPPLTLIRRNPELIPCLACGDSKEKVFVFQCSSQHVTCIECFRQFIKMKLNERQFIQDEVIGYTLGCPALCRNSLIKDSHHFKLLGKYDYDRYQRFATEEYVLKLGGVLCPQPDCGMGILPVDTGCNKIACLHGCGYVFCRRCLEGWHLGDCRDSLSTQAQGSSASSNSGYAVAADRADQAQWKDHWDAKSRRAVRLTTKPCPNCRVSTERAAGCHHMACPKCQFEWCWLCQVKWDRTCQGNHWF